MKRSIKVGALLLALSTWALFPPGTGKVVGSISHAAVPSVIVVVIDGLEPETVNAQLTPNIWGLVEAGEARSYKQANAIMITETNPNHTAMLTGTYGDSSGLFANSFFNTKTGAKEAMERPGLILSPTLFDAIETQDPSLGTASIMGKEKLRKLYDCTRTPAGTCGANSDNPEGVSVTHKRPDYVGGATTSFDPDAIHDDAMAESATSSGYAMDNEVMDIAIAKAMSPTAPNFSFVNLGVVDGFQHLFGSRSPEGLSAVMNADANVGRLVTALKDAGRWENTVLFVLADHSFEESGTPVGPEAVSVKNPVTPFITGTQVSLSDTLGTCPGVQFSAVSHGGAASIYLRSGYDAYSGSGLTQAHKDCLMLLRSRALAKPAVSQAYFRIPVGDDPSATLSNAHPEWRLDSPRVGELLLIADDSSSFVETPSSSKSIESGVHGGPSTAPIPFFVASGSPFLVDGRDLTNWARPLDIAPTVAWLLGIDPPSDSEGRILCEAFSTCP